MMDRRSLRRVVTDLVRREAVCDAMALEREFGASEFGPGYHIEAHDGKEHWTELMWFSDSRDYMRAIFACVRGGKSIIYKEGPCVVVDGQVI